MKKLTELEEASVKNWGHANKSDPFAENVARAHYQNGICDSTREGKSMEYEVTEGKEIHLTSEGKEYFIPIFKNLKRP